MVFKCAMFLPWLLGLVAGKVEQKFSLPVSGAALDCSQEDPCNMTATTNLPIIVKEGFPWSIKFTTDNFELCKDDDNADDKLKCGVLTDQIELIDGSGKDCALLFNWKTGNDMDKESLQDCTSATSRPSTWKARYEGNGVNEIGVNFERAHEEDR